MNFTTKNKYNEFLINGNNNTNEIMFISSQLIQL
jgi:hypothetical protein